MPVALANKIVLPRASTVLKVSQRRPLVSSVNQASPAAPPSSHPKATKTIYVGNIPRKVSEADTLLRSKFGKHGPFVAIRYPKRDSQNSFFCFFEFEQPSHARSALQEDGDTTLSKEHPLKVAWAKTDILPHGNATEPRENISYLISLPGEQSVSVCPLHQLVNRPAEANEQTSRDPQQHLQVEQATHDNIQAAQATNGQRTDKDAYTQEEDLDDHGHRQQEQGQQSDSKGPQPAEAKRFPRPSYLRPLAAMAPESCLILPLPMRPDYVDRYPGKVLLKDGQYEVKGDFALQGADGSILCAVRHNVQDAIPGFDVQWLGQENFDILQQFPEIDRGSKKAKLQGRMGMWGLRYSRNKCELGLYAHELDDHFLHDRGHRVADAEMDVCEQAFEGIYKNMVEGTKLLMKPAIGIMAWDGSKVRPFTTLSITEDYVSKHHKDDQDFGGTFLIFYERGALSAGSDGDLEKRRFVIENVLMRPGAGTIMYLDSAALTHGTDLPEIPGKSVMIATAIFTKKIAVNNAWDLAVREGQIGGTNPHSDLMRLWAEASISRQAKRKAVHDSSKPTGPSKSVKQPRHTMTLRNRTTQ